MNEAYTRAEHEEYRKAVDERFARIVDEDKRQNHRLDKVEESTEKISNLTLSITKMAQSVESLADSVKNQNGRLVELESQDGKRWRQMMGYLASALIGAAVTLGVAAIRAAIGV